MKLRNTVILSLIAALAQAPVFAGKTGGEGKPKPGQGKHAQEKRKKREDKAAQAKIKQRSFGTQVAMEKVGDGTFMVYFKRGRGIYHCLVGRGKKTDYLQNTTSQDGFSPIAQAVIAGDTNKIEKLIDSGAVVCLPEGSNDETLLHLAVRHHVNGYFLKVVKVLQNSHLFESISTKQNLQGLVPLDVALQIRNTTAVDFLVNKRDQVLPSNAIFNAVANLLANLNFGGDYIINHLTFLTGLKGADIDYVQKQNDKDRSILHLICHRAASIDSANSVECSIIIGLLKFFLDRGIQKLDVAQYLAQLEFKDEGVKKRCVAMISAYQKPVRKGWFSWSK